MNDTPQTRRQKLGQNCMTLTLLGIGVLAGAAWLGMAILAPCVDQVVP